MLNYHRFGGAKARLKYAAATNKSATHEAVQHIQYYIDHCPCCQKMNMLKIPIHAHGFTTSTYTPMECLNIDFIQYRSVSGSRIYPGHSRYFHSMGRIVSYY